MRPLTPCAACGGREIYVIDEATMPDYRYSNSFVALTLTGDVVKTEGGFLSSTIERRLVRLAAHVCAACGHTALFARDLEVLDLLAKDGHVRKISF